MKGRALFFSLILFSSVLSGCFGDDEEEDVSRFSWPENVDSGCGVEAGSDFNCTLYLDGFQTPVKVLHSPSEEEIWIVDLSGQITAWDGNQHRQIANLSENVSTCHNEQGLLGMEFTDDFTTTGMVLLSYVETGPCNSEHVASLILAEATLVNGIISYDSLLTIHEIEQPYRNHNGGSIQSVGNNQYLWGIGDGGGSKDPLGHGQNQSNAYGSMLLFEHTEHAIEPVMVDDEGNETFVLHSGLRNPWKYDVDPSGGLWIADVGQYCYEEVNHIAKWNESANFGWSTTEGLHHFEAEAEVCDAELFDNENSSITLPVMEYDHTGGNCSVSGGQYVDWGEETFNNSYVFGDFCSGMIWTLQGPNDMYNQELLVDTNIFLVGFGQGLHDELLMLSWSGQIYALQK